jgi:uncharacterized repeat protein (TIGR02543 family)
MNASGYTLSSGAYVSSYTPGTSLSLPASSVLTNSDPKYYFSGWYDNAEFTGSAVSSISSSDYGNKEYYAKWTLYEAAYETAADTWAYGTLTTAFSYVYDGGTIKLLRDAALYGAPTIMKNITLETGGSAAKLSVYYYIYIASGSLTIDDANLTIEGSRYGYSYLMFISGTGTLNLKAGTINGITVNGIVIYMNGGIVNISGGTVSSTNGYGLYSSAGTVNVSGGTVSR